MHSKIKSFLPDLKENIDLSQFSTFKIGGKAKYFIEVKNKEKLINTVKAAKKLKIPFFVLGGGSNLLISDKGFNGLVIRIFGGNEIKIKKNKKFAILDVFAGVSFAYVINYTIGNNLKGLEWAMGIPGTIGGAVCGNAGAFGNEIKDTVLGVWVLTSNNKLKYFKNKDCKFGYRESIFKNKKNLIIVRVKLKLKIIDDKQELLKNIQDKIKYRSQGYPKFPNAGSIFKNITNKKDISKILKIKPEILKNIEEKWKGRVPAGFLIESCGLKGKKIGKAMISNEHANCFINLGGAKANDIIALIKLAQKEVFKKFGVKLKEEIVRLSC